VILSARAENKFSSFNLFMCQEMALVKRGENIPENNQILSYWID
jgi:hypothetical protein